MIYGLGYGRGKNAFLKVSNWMAQSLERLESSRDAAAFSGSRRRA